MKNQAAQKETGFRTLTEVTLTKSVKYASEETQSPSKDEGVSAKKIPESSWCFLNSSLSSFAIKLVQKSTFLRFVIQSNETGHGVKDRVVDRSGQLEGSKEAFRKDTNAIWHLSQTLSVTATPWQITHKCYNTAHTSAL